MRLDEPTHPMTLIVGRLLGDRVALVGDTLMTYRDRRKPAFTAEHHLLKARIITPQISVAFAGNEMIAGEAFLALSTAQTEAEILAVCAQHSCRGEEPPDFLVATATPALFKVSAGKVTPEMATWIGDQDAFTAFREAEHSAAKRSNPNGSAPDEPSPDPFSGLTNALRSVISSSKSASVGGFTIRVLMDDGNFTYQDIAVLHAIRTSIPKGVWTQIKTGTAAQGGFSLALMAVEQPIRTVAGHIQQGNLGFVFAPSRDSPDGHYRLQTTSPVDSLGFSMWLEEEYRIQCRSSFRGPRDLARDAALLSLAGEKEQALRAVEQALIQFPGHSLLLELRAQICAEILKVPEALEIAQGWEAPPCADGLPR